MKDRIEVQLESSVRRVFCKDLLAVNILKIPNKYGNHMLDTGYMNHCFVPYWFVNDI